MDDFRLIGLNTIPQLCYFLQWDNGIDLYELDSRVLVKAYSDEDFKSSILTEFGTTSCFNCDWRAYTLFVPRDIGYPDAPGLLDNKLQQRIKRNSIVYRCPDCNGELTRFVAKMFEQP
jgi:hypothetical protein